MLWIQLKTKEAKNPFRTSTLLDFCGFGLLGPASFVGHLSFVNFKGVVLKLERMNFCLLEFLPKLVQVLCFISPRKRMHMCVSLRQGFCLFCTLVLFQSLE